MLSNSAFLLLAICSTAFILDYYYFGILKRIIWKHHKIDISNKELISEIVFNVVIANGIGTKRIVSWFLNKDRPMLSIGVTRSKLLFDKTYTSVFMEVDLDAIKTSSESVCCGFIYRIKLDGFINKKRFEIRLYKICITSKAKEKIRVFMGTIKAEQGVREQ